MELLYRKHEAVLAMPEKPYIRPIYYEIPWENSLTAILGARGVGKTTLLLQRLRSLNLSAKEALYIDLGDLYFQENRVINFIEEFIANGGKYLFIDEVHHYTFGSWALELKQAYDIYRHRLTITFTGSSAIRLLNQGADLSRRVLYFKVQGLSFREYLELTEKRKFSSYSLTDILEDHISIQRDLLGDQNFYPLVALKKYWQEGYYPFFLNESLGYSARIAKMVQLVLESDIPHLSESRSINLQALSRLLFAVASSSPFKPNISKLSSRLGITRNLVAQYLYDLANSDLIIALRSETKGIASLAKPDKIYLNNPNLAYALAPNAVDIGTIRETFFANQLIPTTQEKHILPPELKLPKQGDFVLATRNGDYYFEVGGPNKGHQQIEQKANHFLVVDAERTGSDHRIPLWLFGFLG